MGPIGLLNTEVLSGILSLGVSGFVLSCIIYSSNKIRMAQNEHLNILCQYLNSHTVADGHKITQIVLGEHKVITAEQQFLGVILSYFMLLRWPWLS